jgi:hypothetical protein
VKKYRLSLPRRYSYPTPVPMFERFRTLDLHPKFRDEFREKTRVGGVGTSVCCGVVWLRGARRHPPAGDVARRQWQPQCCAGRKLTAATLVTAPDPWRRWRVCSVHMQHSADRVSRHLPGGAVRHPGTSMTRRLLRWLPLAVASVADRRAIAARVSARLHSSCHSARVRSALGPVAIAVCCCVAGKATCPRRCWSAHAAVPCCAVLPHVCCRTHMSTACVSAGQDRAHDRRLRSQRAAAHQLRRDVPRVSVWSGDVVGLHIAHSHLPESGCVAAAAAVSSGVAGCVLSQAVVLAAVARRDGLVGQPPARREQQRVQEAAGPGGQCHR